MPVRKARGYLHRHRVGVASILAVAVAAACLTAYLLSSQGNRARDARLHDSGVWVSTNQTTGPDGTAASFGQINVPVEQFATVLTPAGTGTSLDVLQLGSVVLGYDRNNGALTPINPVTQTLARDDALSLGGRTPLLGGDASTGTLAVLDPAEGGLWAMTVDAGAPVGSLARLDAAAPPLASVGARAAAAVGVDGSVQAVSASGGITTASPRGGGWRTTAAPLPGGLSADLSITAVGRDPVVLSRPATGPAALVLPGGRVVELGAGAGEGPVLQQPGPSSPDVLVATDSALIAVSLDTGAARTLFAAGGGAPAAPVSLRGCAFGAWAGEAPVAAAACGDGEPGASAQSRPLPTTRAAAERDVAFRSNHGELVLNDRATGEVWDDLGGAPRQIADWQAASVPSEGDPAEPRDAAGDDDARAPVAHDDSLGARPGRVTVLRVLDNDSTVAGTVLTVGSVSALGSAAGAVRVAPDRQSVLIDLPADAAGSYTFSYDVTNGNKVSERPAQVTVAAVAPDFHAVPRTRAGFAPSTWSVPANGSIRIPVLNDWRVYENGDPAALGPLGPSATTEPGASAVSTADGSILYTAGSAAGSDVISYTVVNGGDVAEATVSIEVQARADRAAPPIAHDDYVRAVVGAPLTVFPLQNDLPGSDPLDPTAELAIAGTIRGRSGLTVGSPDGSGGVLITASVPGDYILEYSAGYGAAPLSAPASIRVSAEAPDAAAAVETAPDAVTLRGLASALADPTANDGSPLGDLLTVIEASAADGANVDVAVVRGKWLRISQREAVQEPRIETVAYTITDGRTSARGEVAVVQLPAVANDVPVTVADEATVRAGAQVIVSVLDNDVDPSGDGLSLAQNVDGAPAPGQLPVAGAGGEDEADLGAAYVSGNQVRFNAPADLGGDGSGGSGGGAPRQVRVTYLAQNSQGQQVPGALSIIVTPALAPDRIDADQPPAPPDLEARVVAGGVVSIPVPTTGIDPDGDAAQVLGLAMPEGGDPQTKLGAIVGVSATGFTYQAYPSASSAGTDVFDYQMIDAYGRVGQGTVRIAVVQPTVLPPPVAHGITLTAAPGADLRVHVISPAYVDYPDGAPPTLVDPDLLVAEGSSIADLDDANPGWLTVHVPEGRTGESASALYEVTADLGAASRAQITVTLDEGYVAPPVVVDQFARIQPGDAEVSVDLLAGAYSRTGGTLSVRPQPGVEGSTLTVALSDVPRVIPFVVIDSDGGVGTAAAFIPAGGTSALPFWNRSTVTIPADGASAHAIADLVTDPACADLKLTDVQKVWASPSPGLSARITGEGTLELSAADGYQGPGSVTFAVTCSGDPNAYTLITVPVVIGDPTPLLRCATDVIDVQQGLLNGAAVSPATLCHVWAPPQIEVSSLTFHLAWSVDPGGVAIRGNDSARMALFADRDSAVGALGTLEVSINGYKGAAGRLAVRIVPAPAMRIAPIPVQSILATGEPTAIDLASYVASPFGSAAVSIVRFGDIPQASVEAGAGRRALLVRADSPDASGARVLSYTVTDVSDLSDSSRWVTGNIMLQFIGAPGAPTAVAPRPGFAPRSVLLSWVAPPANGAPIDMYEVSYSGSGAGSQQCTTGQGCTIVDLVNGGEYRFAVRARNLAGWGPWSELSGSGYPDAIPGIVLGFAAGDPRDGEVTLRWQPLLDESSSADWSYTISWSGAVSGSAVISDRSAGAYTVTGLDNNEAEDFSIAAANRAGVQQTPSRAVGQSAGRPAPPVFAAEGITPTKTASGGVAMVVSWAAVEDPNGPGPVVYTLTRTGDGGGSPVVVCAATTATACTDADVSANGQAYVYAVTSANRFFGSDSASSVRVEVSIPPEQMAAPTIRPVQPADPDDTVTITFTTAPANGGALAVRCAYTADGSAPTAGSTPCPTSPWGGYAPAGGQTDSKTLSGLAGGRSAPVRFVVWADNGGGQFGQGPASPASGSVLTNAPPPAPTPLGGGCGLDGDQITYSWSPVAGTNGRAIEYLAREGADDPGIVTSATSRAVRHPGSSGGSFSLTVSARDSAGDTSAALTITCPGPLPQPPPPVTGLTCAVEPGSTVIAWTWTNPVVPAGVDTAYRQILSGAAEGEVVADNVRVLVAPDSGAHTLTVVTVDSGGQRSAPVSATCAAPAAARISLARGAAANQGDGCMFGYSSGECYDLVITFSEDFPPGLYTFTGAVRFNGDFAAWLPTSLNGNTVTAGTGSVLAMLPVPPGSSVEIEVTSTTTGQIYRTSLESV